MPYGQKASSCDPLSVQKVTIWNRITPANERSFNVDKGSSENSEVWKMFCAEIRLFQFSPPKMFLLGQECPNQY